MKKQGEFVNLNGHLDICAHPNCGLPRSDAFHNPQIYEGSLHVFQEPAPAPETEFLTPEVSISRTPHATAAEKEKVTDAELSHNPLTDTHTPGPWTANLDSDHGDYTVWGPGPEDAFLANIGTEGRVIAFDVAEANARLMARAPELLVECAALRAERDTLAAELETFRHALTVSVRVEIMQQKSRADAAVNALEELYVIFTSGCALYCGGVHYDWEHPPAHKILKRVDALVKAAAALTKSPAPSAPGTPRAVAPPRPR